MNQEMYQLIQRQSLDLDIKEKLTKRRIELWYNYYHGNVYVSFSGGKDSTVLLHQVRKVYPEVPAVFVDTGLEYPEIRNFVRNIPNVTYLHPKMAFHKVIQKYGYPIISKEVSQKIDEIRNTKSEVLKQKRLFGDSNKCGKLAKKWNFLIDAPFKISNKCCNVMKKSPIHKYERTTDRKPFLGTMVGESSLRKITYLKNGCNAFNSKRPVSTPMAFWTEKDVWDYIKKYNVKYSDIYDKGFERTGCMFCMFGVQFEKGFSRFDLMKETHPKIYDYCMNSLKINRILEYITIKK